MAPILRSRAQSLPAASSVEDTSSDSGSGSGSGSDGDEVEQQPTTVIPPPPPEQGQDSEGEEEEIESSEELVAHGTPTKEVVVVAPPPPPPPSNGRVVSDSDGEDSDGDEDEDSGDEEAPLEPPLQTKENVDDGEDEDDETDGEASSEPADQHKENVPPFDDKAPPEPNQKSVIVSPELKRKAPLAEAVDSPNGKRKAATTEVAESPQQKRRALQAVIAGSIEAAAPTKDDSFGHCKGNTDMEKQFEEKIASFFYLGKEVLVLDEEHSGLFKQAFLKLGDHKASALDTRIKKLSLAEVRLSLRRRDLEKEVTKLLLDLLKSS